jgi:hypothetical protein
MRSEATKDPSCLGGQEGLSTPATNTNESSVTRFCTTDRGDLPNVSYIFKIQLTLRILFESMHYTTHL